MTNQEQKSLATILFIIIATLMLYGSVQALCLVTGLQPTLDLYICNAVVFILAAALVSFQNNKK